MRYDPGMSEAAPVAPLANSKLAGASLTCALVTIPTAMIGWAARGTDQDWIWPIGAITTIVLWIASAALGVAGVVVIVARPDRTRGIGFAVAALVLVAAEVVWSLAAILTSR